jgi:[ribosomal protein S18]-alanine N-acetyltransferase
MQFRLYQPGDFAQLYTIEESCFPSPLRFSRAYMRELVNNPSAATWLAEDQGQLAGFAIVKWMQVEAGTIAYIETIEVAAANRKQGIGAELLRRVEISSRTACAKAIWLHVDAENSSAIRLYEAHGYKQHGREEHYYARQRPAIIYSKKIGEVANSDSALSEAVN